MVIIEHFSLSLTAEALIRRKWPLLKGVGHFGLSIRLKDYVYRQHLYTFIRKWFYYNFAAGSVHTKKFCRRLYSIKLKFYTQKRQICFLSHPLGELGVTYALHLQTERENCDPKDRASIAASRGKNAVKSGLMHAELR